MTVIRSLACVSLVLLCTVALATHRRRPAPSPMGEDAPAPEPVPARDEAAARTALRCADASARGIYPVYAPDLATAARLYREVALRAAQAPRASKEAKAKLATLAPLREVDVAGPPIPLQVARRVAERRVDRGADAAAHAPTTDPQNVHDSATVAGTKANVQALVRRAAGPGEDAAGIATARAFDDVLTAIGTRELDDAVRCDAVKTMSSLTDNTHSNFNISERQALAAVWGVIGAQADGEIRSNLVETLIKGLASSVEGRHVVCSTGKIARIVGSLDGVEHGVCPELKASANVAAVRATVAELAVAAREEGATGAEFFERTVARLGDDPHMSKGVLESIVRDYADELG